MFEEAITFYLKQHGFAEFDPRAVLFDMDGVLFDSMPAHARTWEAVAKRYSLELNAREAYMHEGRTGAATIELLSQRSWGRSATPREVEEIYAEKCRLFNAEPEAPQMPSAARLLTEVKADGFDAYVVTGSGQQSLLDRIEHSFPGSFKADHVVSSRDVHHGKPSPEPYQLALRRAGLAPWQAIVVENAPLGVESAVAAGVFTVAVNTGPLPPEALLERGANILFPSMTALADAWSASIVPSIKRRRCQQ